MKPKVLESERPSRLCHCVRFNAEVSRLRRTADVYDVVYATCAMCGFAVCAVVVCGMCILFIIITCLFA